MELAKAIQEYQDQHITIRATSKPSSVPKKKKLDPVEKWLNGCQIVTGFKDLDRKINQ